MTKYLSLPGTNGHNTTTPDHADLDITGDIDIRVDVELDDWTPASELALLGKWTLTGDQRSYLTTILGDPAALRIYRSTDGANSGTQVSDTFTPSSRLQLRMTLDVDNGAAGQTRNYYFRAANLPLEDNTGWTQISEEVAAGTTSIFASTAILEIGSFAAGTQGNLAGKVYEGLVMNGIAGTVVAHFDADDFNVGDSDGATAVDSTGKTWTIVGASSIIIGPPSNVAAVADSTDQITVTWDDVSGEDGYIVERSLDGSTGWTDVSGTLPAGTTSYADTGLDPSTEYFYRVISVFTEGNSEPSAVVSATTPTGEESNRMTGGAIRKPPRVRAA